MHTFWFDGVELSRGSISALHGMGGISINAVISTPLSLKNQSDSTNAVNVQNTQGRSAFNIDTLNSNTTVSNATDNGGLTVFGDLTKKGITKQTGLANIVDVYVHAPASESLLVS